MLDLVRRPGRRSGFLRLAPLLLIAAVWSAAFSAGAAYAREVAVSGKPMGRYGRILLEFDQPVKVAVRATGSVVVIGFAEPARIRSEKLAVDLRDYIEAVRRDPDNTGFRLALGGQFRVNVLTAGERVFIDLLPPNWTGMLPGLPPEVVAELSERVRIAEEQIRREAALRPRVDIPPVKVRLAELPGLTRLVFEPPPGVPIRVTNGAEAVELVVDAATRLDNGGARPNLAPGVKTFEVDKGASSLSVRIAAAPGYGARGFPEDGSVVVDLVAPGAIGSKPPPVPAESIRTQPAPAPPGRPGEARPETARTAGAASGSSSTAVAAAAPAAPAAQVPAPPVASSAAPAGKELAPQGPTGPPVTVTPRLEAEPTRLSLLFPFRTRTAAAAYLRDGLLTLVFATRDVVDRSALERQVGGLLDLRHFQASDGYLVLRFANAGTGPVRLLPDTTGWRLSLGDNASLAPDALKAARALDDNGHGVVAIGLANANEAHWMTEPDGQRVAVVTAYGRAQALPLSRSFVEFALPATLHGVLVEAAADDLTVALGQGGVIVTREGGLSLSSAGRLRADGSPAPQISGLVISRENWFADTAGDVLQRYHDLVSATANAPQSGRAEARFRLARFLLANGLSHEAAGVLALARRQDALFARRRETIILSAIAAMQSGRYTEGRALLSTQDLADDTEAALWRAVADTADRRWAAALGGFRRTTDVTELYPDELAGTVHLAGLRAAIGGGDIQRAEGELAAIDRLSTGAIAPDEHDLARARVDDAAGRWDAALKEYEKLTESGREKPASEALLRYVDLAYRTKAIDLEAAVNKLEGLLVTWHGGDIEIGTVSALARLYGKAGRWRDLFTLTRRAEIYFPNHELTRSLHDETTRLLEQLLLGEGEKLSAVQALALFFDFKELAPIGRRGDEIVRRLADRLVEIDLLDQAADLLQYQVDKRLTGTARAAVAARLATIRLMNGKPLQALAALQSTRMAEQPEEIRRVRLALEARAQSDLSRTDLALEMIDGETGRDFARLHAGILWTARRWREAGEASEALVGTRWNGPEPLGDEDRGDVLRAAVAYVMGDERLALDRLRQKFSPKMLDSPAAKTFALLLRPGIGLTREFRNLVQDVSRADSLREFLTHWQADHPNAFDAGARPNAGSAAAASTIIGGPKPVDPPPESTKAEAGAPGSPNG